jgi:hypothetical protein
MDPKLAIQLESVIRQIVREEVALLMSNQSAFDRPGTEIQCSGDIPMEVISNKIGWLKGEKALIKFHETLISYGFLVCKFEFFKMHFIGTQIPVKKINWNTHTKRLIYLFDQLIAYKYIPDNDEPHNLLRMHFIDVRGNDLVNERLRTSLNDIRNNKPIKIIDNIISEIEKGNYSNDNVN